MLTDVDMESAAGFSVSDDNDARVKSISSEGKQSRLTSPTGSKSEAMLDALLIRVHDRQPSTRLDIYSQRAASANARSNPATLIAQKMHQLDALDRRSHSLSVSINLCYFALGEAYRQFAQV